MFWVWMTGLMGLGIWCFWYSAKADKRAAELAAEQADALKAHGQPESQQPTATTLYERPLSQNQAFLHEIRSQSCYPVLRSTHAFLTIAALIATGILWLVLLNKSPGNVERIYVSFVCGLVIVALLIEYGLFRLIVDAVDVLIDTGRRQAANEAGK